MARLFPARGLTSRGASVAPVNAEQKAAVQLPAPAFWLTGNPYRNDLPLAEDVIHVGTAFSASALVYACMTFRARKLSEAPLWLADEADGNESWLAGTEDHPLSPLLEQPNPDQHAAAFLSALSLAMDMGPALVLKNRDNAGRVGSLYVFTFDQFTVEPDVVDGVPRLNGKFTITDGDGRQHVRGPADVLYFPPMGGVSPVDAALAHVRISDRMRRAIKSSLAKAMRPGSVLTLGAELEDNQFQRYKSQLHDLYAGEDNAGRNVVVDGVDAKFQLLQAGLKDLELGPVQGDVEAAICQSFGIHPALVGAKIALENSSGLSDSLKPSLSLFYDLVGFPRWAEVETAFTAGLLREVDPSPVRFVRFVKDDVRALAPDLTANVNVAKAATGIMTLNEQRAALALPPVDGPEGDAISAPAGTGQAPTDPARQGTQPVKAAQPERKDAAPSIETKRRRLVTDADRDAYWRDMEQKAAKGRPAYEATARRLFREERAGVLATLRAAVPKSAAPTLERKDDGGTTSEEQRLAILAALQGPYLEAAALQIAADFAEGGVYAQAWAEEFRVLLTATIQTAAGEFAQSAGFRVAFSMENPAFQRAVQDRLAALVQHVGRTTAEAITDAIATGRAEGLTVEQIAARVDERAFGAMARERARMIAETEVVGAINEAEWVAANESGAFRSKRWIHSRGAEGRKHHIRFEHEGEDGGWVPMSYVYQGLNGARFGRPHEPGMPARESIRCDCVLAYSDVDPSQANAESKAREDAERQRKLVDAAITALATPQPAPVVHVTLPPAPTGGTKRVTLVKDDRGVTTAAEITEG